MQHTNIKNELQELLQKVLNKVQTDTLSKRIITVMTPNTTIEDGKIVYTHPVKGRMDLEEAIIMHALEEAKEMGIKISKK